MTRQCDSGETSPFRAPRRCGLYSRASPPPSSRRARLQSRLRHRGYSRARTVSQLELRDGSTNVTYTARCDVAAGRTHEAACPPVTGLRGSVANCFHQAPESRDPAVCSGSRQIAVECQRRTCLGSKPCEHALDRKSTRLNSSHLVISYAVFCLKKKKKNNNQLTYETQI